MKSSSHHRGHIPFALSKYGVFVFGVLFALTLSVSVFFLLAARGQSPDVSSVGLPFSSETAPASSAVPESSLAHSSEGDISLPCFSSVTSMPSSLRASSAPASRGRTSSPAPSSSKRVSSKGASSNYTSSNYTSSNYTSSKAASSAWESSSSPGPFIPPAIENDLSAVTIMGQDRATAEMMATYLLNNRSAPKLTCTVWELVNYYLEEGRKEGVRGDIAFCQSINETGWFTGYERRDGRPEDCIVKYYMNNFCGLGATGSTPPCQFANARLGVQAQIQHLKAYASKAPLNYPCVDPRFKYVRRELFIYWGDMGGSIKIDGVEYTKWASSSGCGATIIKLYKNLMSTVPDASKVAKAKQMP